jgi:hypothetical protein
MAVYMPASTVVLEPGWLTFSIRMRPGFEVAFLVIGTSAIESTTPAGNIESPR